jgi:GT2 family glycosyltransferase
MAVFAMVTTKKSASYTVWALRTFFAHTPLTNDDRFILIDNDGGYELPADCALFPVELLVNKKPLSFAANVNQMAQQALDLNTALYFLNNDVIFSRDWIVDFLAPLDVALVPISNREVQYTLPRVDSTVPFTCPMRMELEDYLGHEREFDRIAEIHRERSALVSRYLPVLCAPFFVVKLPPAVLSRLGAFDLRFGVGGGEDYDYCLRTHLAGFSVAFVQRSFVLHFGAKSISVASGADVEPFFVTEFRNKWGDRATKMIFDDRPGVLEELGIRRDDFQRQGFTSVIDQLIENRKVEIYHSF